MSTKKRSNSICTRFRRILHNMSPGKKVGQKALMQWVFWRELIIKVSVPGVISGKYSREHRTPAGGSELAQESQVVVEEQADVVDSVLQHGNAFDAQPEGEAGVGFRVVADGLEDRGMDHAGAQDLEPAGGLADPAAVAAAHDAFDIDFRGWFGEGKVAGAEADAHLRPKIWCTKAVRTPLRSAKVTPLSTSRPST